MFPEIFRDDVFRLETRRLWLRWPTARDEAAIERFAGMEDVATMTASIPHPYPPGGAASFIYQARVGNAQGSQLTFALAPLARPHEAIGVASLRNEEGRLTLGYWLAPPCWGRGLMSEAVEALVDTTFQLTMVKTIYSSVRADNVASRRVLTKCGFVPSGEPSQRRPMRERDHACVSYSRQRVPNLLHRTVDRPEMDMPQVLAQSA